VNGVVVLKILSCWFIYKKLNVPVLLVFLRPKNFFFLFFVEVSMHICLIYPLITVDNVKLKWPIKLCLYFESGVIM